MALTQSARLPGPSWDEEVVPALRKRLESESRTLARRMSAISLSSQDDSQTFSMLAESTAPAPISPFLQSNASSALSRPAFQNDEPRPSFDRISPSSRVNGSTPHSKKKPTAPPFTRSRTYSQPYLADLPNGKSPASRPKSNSRPADTKPTRIPRPPGSASSTGHSPQIPNGSTLYQTAPSDLYHAPDLHVVHETTSINSSRSNIAIPTRQTPHLLNEPAPFAPGSLSSVSPSHYDIPEEASPPRPSNDSEERPFEHWYRGDMSRNGGVGELRVGRRQEMLEIANYGHMIRSTTAAARAAAAQGIADDGRYRRKRADSVSGIGIGAARDRGSLYLDDEHARRIGRVLDEDPLTDLEDGSDAASTSDHHHHHHHQLYAPAQAAGDMSTASAPLPQPQPDYDTRSAAPTPTPRAPSRQHSAPPTRIPAPPSRQSSESRVPTPTQTHRGSGEAPHAPSPSGSVTPPPPAVRQRQPSRPSPAGTPAKRAASPPSAVSAKKSRTAASRATRAKTAATRREVEEEAKRRSVAYYPTPADEDLAMDAIPTWTQPVPKQGNWDEVVLPVVARKKGLDGHYEQADGKPQPRKRDTMIEPAPGTFGFDHSKYRPPRDHESIPMDEFGRPADRAAEDKEPEQRSHPVPPLQLAPSAHDETRLPTRHPPPPSPAPFSDYAPTTKAAAPPGTEKRDLEQGRPGEEDDDDGAGGCCKCVIM